MTGFPTPNPFMATQAIWVASDYQEKGLPYIKRKNLPPPIIVWSAAV